MSFRAFLYVISSKIKKSYKKSIIFASLSMGMFWF